MSSLHSCIPVYVFLSFQNYCLHDLIVFHSSHLYISLIWFPLPNMFALYSAFLSLPQVSEIFSTSCVLTFGPPKDDGGLPLTYYHVERQDFAVKGKNTRWGECLGTAGSCKVIRKCWRSKNRCKQFDIFTIKGFLGYTLPCFPSWALKQYWVDFDSGFIERLLRRHIHSEFSQWSTDCQCFVMYVSECVCICFACVLVCLYVSR